MRFRLIILVALAVFLVWEVVTRSVAAYLADASPETAIALRSTEAYGAVEPGRKKLSRSRLQKKLSLSTQLHSAANQDTRPAEVQSQQSLDTAGQNSPLSAPCRWASYSNAC